MDTKSEKLGRWGRIRRNTRFQPWKLIIAVIIVIIVGGVGVAIFKPAENDSVEEKESVLATVTVSRLGDLLSNVSVEKVAAIEPAINAPLVARTGGRITSIEVGLGSAVDAREIVVTIDGQGIANPARAQANAAVASLATFDRIYTQALKSADNGINIAKLTVQSAKSGQSLTNLQVVKGREQADLSLRGAELTLNDVLESDSKTDALERSAHLAIAAAELVQDQATIAKNLAKSQSLNGVKVAEENLAGALIAKDKLIADLAGQRVSIAGVAAAAREQVRLAQVVSPVNGQVTRLTVRQGDFVKPGQIVGEVTAFEGASITVAVSTGLRGKLAIGQQLPLFAKGQEFTGEIVNLAEGPSAESTLWQVDVFVSSTPKVVQPGELITIRLPVGGIAQSESDFIPLDAVTVRQDGVVVFAVNDEGLASEHFVNVSGFTSDFVEGKVDLPDDAQIVIEGNRLLRDGDTVVIR